MKKLVKQLLVPWIMLFAIIVGTSLLSNSCNTVPTQHAPQGQVFDGGIYHGTVAASITSVGFDFNTGQVTLGDFFHAQIMDQFTDRDTLTAIWYDSSQSHIPGYIIKLSLDIFDEHGIHGFLIDTDGTPYQYTVKKK